MSEQLTFRPATATAQDFLVEMLIIAAQEKKVADIEKNPDLKRYIHNWGRHGDHGYIAEFDEQLVGAAWCRLWSQKNKGYGFVDEQTPELAIAVLPEYQNRGIGRELITKLVAKLSPDYQAISLSTRTNNPAFRLYKSLGFVALENTKKQNRVGGISVIMVKKLEEVGRSPIV